MYEEKNIVHFMTHQLYYLFHVLILHTCTVFSSTLLPYISDVLSLKTNQQL